MTIDMTQFYQVFFEESAEHLLAMESLLLALNVEQPDGEALNAIFRAAHSIKGSSGTFGFTDLAEVTHILETVLDRLRKHEIPLRAGLVDVCLDAGDLLKSMLAAHQGGAATDPQVLAAVCKRLADLAADSVPAPAPAAAGAEQPPAIAPVEANDAYGFFDAPALPDPLVPDAASDADDGEGEGYGFFAPLPELAPAQADAAPPGAARAPPALAAAAAEAASIRVGVDKVDQMVNLVGELVITQAMLLQCAERLPGAAPERLLQGLAQLERNTRELQASVMSIRMLPISSVFSRFPRVVRDLSAKLGKQVELKLSGEATELDKGLIEKIADPLTHLVRNSLDHGIELPAVRVAAGKPPGGTITLRAAHRGGNIVIEVGDDGAGLCRQRILAKARERGLPVADRMSDQEVWMLIFEAGFSTADVVTDVSGRGVGMDVVRRNIQALGGRVDIESVTGVGTRMTVRLPLTLAILDGMSVAVGNQTYILPLSCVIESLQPDAQDIKTLANQARLVRVRGEYLPVIVLHELFGIKPVSADFTQGIIIVLDVDGGRTALYVDALIGQQPVVIKSLENNFRRVAGISGATIMGDGHVALILDVAALAGMAKSVKSAPMAAA